MLKIRNELFRYIFGASENGLRSRAEKYVISYTVNNVLHYRGIKNCNDGPVNIHFTSAPIK